MIIYECIKTFDKIKTLFLSFPVDKKMTCFLQQHCFIHRWDIFITKNANSDIIYSFNFNFFIIPRSFISLKSSSFANSLSVFLIPPGRSLVIYKYLTKNGLKYSLSSVFWICKNHFLDCFILLLIWYNCN